MYARIATFQGDPDRIDESIDAARKQVEADWDSPPEGLEGRIELWTARTASQRRTNVTFYEVALHKQRD